jgi:Homeodomain-like domain
MSLKASILRLSHQGVPVRKIAQRTGASLNYVYVVRARARKTGAPVPRQKGANGGGWALRYRQGTALWNALARDRLRSLSSGCVDVGV